MASQLIFQTCESDVFLLLKALYRLLLFQVPAPVSEDPRAPFTAWPASLPVILCLPHLLTCSYLGLLKSPLRYLILQGALCLD